MTLMNGELARKCVQIENHEYFQKLFLFINRKRCFLKKITKVILRNFGYFCKKEVYK